MLLLNIKTDRRIRFCGKKLRKSCFRSVNLQLLLSKDLSCDARLYGFFLLFCWNKFSYLAIIKIPAVCYSVIKYVFRKRFIHSLDISCFNFMDRLIYLALPDFVSLARYYSSIAFIISVYFKNNPSQHTLEIF